MRGPTVSVRRCRRSASVSGAGRAPTWSTFWRFRPNGLAELLHRLGAPASVAGYGNVLACVASLWGSSVEELSAEELDVADPRLPLVARAHAEKAR
jgi:hypothetical protein